MSPESTFVALFADSLQLQAGLRTLRAAGFDLGKLSLIGKNQHWDADVTGWVDSGTGMRCWGRFSALTATLAGAGQASALLVFPGVGQVAVFGPLVHQLAAAMARPQDALGSTLCSAGLPPDAVLRYDSAIRNGRLAVLARGTAAEVRSYQRLLAGAGAIEVHEHGRAMVAAPASGSIASVVQGTVMPPQHARETMQLSKGEHR